MCAPAAASIAAVADTSQRRRISKHIVAFPQTHPQPSTPGVSLQRCPTTPTRCPASVNAISQWLHHCCFSLLQLGGCHYCCSLVMTSALTLHFGGCITAAAAMQCSGCTITSLCRGTAVSLLQPVGCSACVPPHRCSNRRLKPLLPLPTWAGGMFTAGTARSGRRQFNRLRSQSRAAVPLLLEPAERCSWITAPAATHAIGCTIAVEVCDCLTVAEAASLLSQPIECCKQCLRL